MEVNEVLCLKWNNHKSIFLQNLSSLRTQEFYSDATLACNGKYFSVHRLVLSTCSEYFEEIFEKMSMQNIHPFIIVTNIESGYLEALLNFMYNGEVNVLHEMLPGLMKAAEVLKIKGLAVPDEEAIDKEVYNVHEREGNTPSVDFKACHPKSPINHTPISKTQFIDESLGSIQNHCSFEGESPHSEVSLSSNIQTPTKNMETSKFQTKEEFFGMYSMESSKQSINSSNDSIIYQHNIVENKNEIKLEHEFMEEKELQSANSSTNTIFPDHLAPQQLTSNVTLSQSTFSQNFINSEENISYCRTSEVDECGKETDIEFEMDHSNDKISGLLVHSEPEIPSDKSEFIATTSRTVKRTRSSHMASHPKQPLKKATTSIVSPPSPPSKKCPKCPYVSKYVSTLRRHIMFKHTGEKPHHCQFCPYRSAHNFNMKKHMMIHTGEKPFSCSLCPYKASQNSNIKAHMKCHEKKLMKVAMRGMKHEK